jgi:hypothetical protein
MGYVTRKRPAGAAEIMMLENDDAGCAAENAYR